MGRATLMLPRDTARAKDWIDRAPLGTRLEFVSNKRSTPQNARLHAMISVVADELVWHGQKLTVDDWKLVFLDAFNRELRIVPNIRGDGFVNLGRKTSRLTKDEFTELMDIVEAFAAKHGVDLREPA